MKSTQESSPEESVSRLSSARKLLVLALIGGVVFLAVYFIFLADDSSPKAPPLPAAEVVKEPQFVKEGELAFLDTNGQDTLQVIDIEVAEGQKEQAQGLMYRSRMDENHGMLFAYPDARPLSFYMKNTKISLDIVYANGDKRIVTIHQGVAPYSEKTLPSGEDAQYVVEVNAGFTTRHGIEEGDLITYETTTQ